MDEDESGRKTTIVQGAFRFALIAIPLFLYGRYVYNTFKPCPKVKSYESGYRYSNSYTYHSIRQRVLEKLIEKCCKRVKTERGVNFEEARRMAPNWEDPCDRYETSDRFDRLEKSKKYSCKAESKFDTSGPQYEDNRTHKNLGKHQKQKRGKKKHPKTDPCKEFRNEKMSNEKLRSDQKGGMLRNKASKQTKLGRKERSNQTQIETNNNLKELKYDGSVNGENDECSSQLVPYIKPLEGKQSEETKAENLSSKDIIEECKKLFDEEKFDSESKMPTYEREAASSKITNETQLPPSEIKNRSENKQQPSETKRSTKNYPCKEPTLEEKYENLSDSKQLKKDKSEELSGQRDIDKGGMKQPNIQREDGRAISDDYTSISIPPEVLDRLCNSYRESYQRTKNASHSDDKAQKLDTRKEKIPSATSDGEPCDESFHLKDPDTPFIVKNYACKNEKSGNKLGQEDRGEIESTDYVVDRQEGKTENEIDNAAKESDPCKDIYESKDSEKSTITEIDDEENENQETRLPVRSAKAEALREQFWHTGVPPKSLTQGCRTSPKKNKSQ